MSSGERPIGAAKSKQSDTEALYQPPPPLRVLLNDSATQRLLGVGWGGGLTPCPPSDPDFIVGKNKIYKRKY